MWLRHIRDRTVNATELPYSDFQAAAFCVAEKSLFLAHSWVKGYPYYTCHEKKLCHSRVNQGLWNAWARVTRHRNHTLPFLMKYEMAVG